MKIRNIIRKIGLGAAVLLMLVMLAPTGILAAPPAPGNLAATVSAGPVVNLTWSDVAGEVGYRVMRANAPGTTFTDLTAGIGGLPANSVSFPDNTVTAGVTYDYQVVAFDLTGNSPPSNTVTITATVPAAPSGLTTQQAGPPQTVTLSWTDNSGNEIGFLIERADNAGFTANLVRNARTANTAAAPVTFIDGNIIPGATYFYRVSALSASGASAPTTAASITINAAAGMVAGPAVPIAGFGAASGYPIYYQDTLGTKLNLLPISGVNLADGVLTSPPYSAQIANYSAALGFGTEAFYYVAMADTTGFGVGVPVIEFAIEAVFDTTDNLATPVDETGAASAGLENVMNRTRIRIDVPVSGTYTITTPYHQGANAVQVAAVAGAAGPDINITNDIMGLASRDFNAATTGPVNVFLRPTAAQPAGLLGDGLTASTVTGGPGGVNSVTVTGPGGVTFTANQWLINGRFLSAPVVPGFTTSVNQATRAVTFTDTTAGTPTGWAWDFGDGASATVQNPSHTYAAAGNFIVRLTAANAGGSASTSQMVSVFSAPGATFTSAVGATPLTLNLTSSTAGNPTGWAWDFGDGSTSALQNPTKVYAAGGVFTVSLRTFNPTGTATTSQVLQVGAPAAPASLAATITSASSVTLNWGNVANEMGYRLEHAANSAFNPVIHSHALAADVITFTETGIPANTTTFWRVIAINGAAESAPSNTVSVTLATPTSPGSLAATAASSQQINLSWTDSTSESSYRVERGTAETGPFTALPGSTLSADTTTFTDLTVTAGTTFFYRVVAINTIGETPSAVTSATTPAAPTAVPTNPTGLNATIISATGVDLTWTDASTDEAGFRIERAASANFTAVDASFTVNAGVTAGSAIVSGNGPFFFRVIAFNSVGNSASPSNTVQVTMAAPAAPVLATVVAASSTQVDITWTDANVGETGFRIERSTGSGTFSTVQTALPNVTSASDITVTPSTTYHYRILAVNGVGASAPSNVIIVTTPATVLSGGGGGGGAVSPSPSATIELNGFSSSAALNVNSSGMVTAAARLEDSAGTSTIDIAAGTFMKAGDGSVLASISISPPATIPDAPPDQAVVVAHEFGPSGATFSPAITITLKFDPAKLPQGADKADLVIAFWNGTEWVAHESTVDASGNTVSAKTPHFTTFAVLSPEAAPAPAAPVPVTTSPEPPTTTAPAAAPPSVSITAPASGAVLPEGSVTVSILTQDFELVAPGGANEAGKGHLHYYMDVTIPTTPGAPAVTAAGTYKASPGTSVVWDNVKAGTHTFGVQLVNSNHTPLEPPVTATVTVTVSAPPPTTTPAATTPATEGPQPAAAPGPNWVLIGGIIAAVVVLAVLAISLMRRKPAKQ